MKTADFDYSLPPELIAQEPVAVRDRSRLLVLDRSDGSVEHRRFFEVIDYLNRGDVLVFNDTRVIPARLKARRSTGANVEILLLRRVTPGYWEALVRPARRARIGSVLTVGIEPTGTEVGHGGQETPGGRQKLTSATPQFDTPPRAGRREEKVSAEVVAEREGGIRVLKFDDESSIQLIGEIPLPPYIHTPLADRERYQTVYSSVDGSVAAPTAGLHFTPELIARLEAKGIICAFVTLHVGLDTFRPVRSEDPREHLIHREYGVVSTEAATAISTAKAEGRRVVCVGTTSMRLVEAAALAMDTGNGPGSDCPVHSQANVDAPRAHVPNDTGRSCTLSFAGWVDLFILPGHRFKVADAMITNFHLPRTTLLMLVSAFAGRELTLGAYRQAIEERYRFYSFGDAMMIL